MTRTGIGFDAHAFADGRPLVIGGVRIPSDRGLEGHSDADVLCHAICDAILGAAALGDIGQHFPSSDAAWKDTPSTEFLRRAIQMIGTVWMRVDAIDATVILESPPIAPHRDAMRKALADAIGVKADDINIKATTTDGLGVIGRGEGAAALAVATLVSTV